MIRVRMAALAAFIAVAACDAPLEDRILSIDAAGTVIGFVWRDVNGTGALEVGDEPVRSADVRLVLAGTRDTVARGRTDSDGFFSFAALPVGRYHVVVPPTVKGDSLVRIRVDFRGEQLTPPESAQVTLGRGDTLEVRVGVAYRTVTIAEARDLLPGEKVFIRGIALASLGALSDTSLYVHADGSAIRATRATGLFIRGDSLHVSGITALRHGQPVLDQARAFRMAELAAPAPEEATTVEAAAADDGRLDAHLVVVAGEVQDTATVDARFRVVLDDGSGELRVVVRTDAGFPIETYAPGATLRVTGILVPRADASAWDLRPRNAADVVVEDPPPDA